MEQHPTIKLQERLLVVAPCQLQLTNITLTKKEIKKQGVFMISFSEKEVKKKKQGKMMNVNAINEENASTLNPLCLGL